MKILQVNKYLHNFGGAEAYMFNLSDALRLSGHEVELWGQSNKKNIEVNHNYNIDYIDYKNQDIIQKIKNSFKTIYNNQSRKNIIPLLEEFKPDIVHLHNYNFQITPSILPEIKKRNITIVQTVHDSQIVCPYHRLYNFRLNNKCTKCVEGSFYNCILDRCFDNSLAASTIGALESYYYHNKNYYNNYIDHIISPSKFLADLISNRFNNEISIIPNFFEYNGKIKKDIKENYFLYYGRLSEEKGVLSLTEIFNKAQIKLKIVGKGPLGKNIDNTKYVEYIGPLYGSELFSLLRNAKFVIQPSKGYENCPMTVVEAFSFGVPVIAPNHSGFKELITNEQTGHLIDFNNKNQLVNFIRKIYNQDLSQMKKKVLKYYKSNLTKKIHIKKILSIYNKYNNAKI